MLQQDSGIWITEAFQYNTVNEMRRGGANLFYANLFTIYAIMAIVQPKINILGPDSQNCSWDKI